MMSSRHQYCLDNLDGLGIINKNNKPKRVRLSISLSNLTWCVMDTRHGLNKTLIKQGEKKQFILLKQNGSIIL